VLRRFPARGAIDGIKVIPKDGTDYTIANVCVSPSGNDSAKTFCRIKKYGKRVNGYLDFAVVTSGDSVVLEGSVKSTFPSRGGVYSENATGFPFEFNLARSVLEGKSLRLAFHKNQKNVIFRSGEKNLAY
jgi:hypothetical protein